MYSVVLVWFVYVLVHLSFSDALFGCSELKEKQSSLDKNLLFHFLYKNGDLGSEMNFN